VSEGVGEGERGCLYVYVCICWECIYGVYVCVYVSECVCVYMCVYVCMCVYVYVCCECMSGSMTSHHDTACNTTRARCTPLLFIHILFSHTW
jgi:hypothetical protein